MLREIIEIIFILLTMANFSFGGVIIDRIDYLGHLGGQHDNTPIRGRVNAFTISIILILVSMLIAIPAVFALLTSVIWFGTLLYFYDRVFLKGKDEKAGKVVGKIYFIEVVLFVTWGCLVLEYLGRL